MLKKIILLLTILITTVTYVQSQDSVNDTLLVGYTTAPPFIVQNNEALEGINIWLWKSVAKDLDLVYKMVPMGFSPMLDSLETGGIDISINPLTITSERNRKMLFTDSFYASNSTIAVADVSTVQKFVQFVKGFFNQNFFKGTTRSFINHLFVWFDGLVFLNVKKIKKTFEGVIGVFGMVFGGRQLP